MSYDQALSDLLTIGTKKRNMHKITYQNDLETFSNGLLSAKKILVVTGFCVESSMTGETDGPLCMFLVRALEKLGIEVDVLTDRYTIGQLKKLKDAFDIQASIHLDPSQTGYDLILAIERPGKGRDGCYHNMHGRDISHIVSDTDTAICDYISDGSLFFAIGDGGNEVGMGKIQTYINAHIHKGPDICSTISADELLIAGVSNWGSYIVTAYLSIVSSINLLQDNQEEIDAFEILLAEGSVDGVTGLNEMSVDGYDLTYNLEILTKIRKVIDRYLEV